MGARLRLGKSSPHLAASGVTDHGPHRHSTEHPTANIYAARLLLAPMPSRDSIEIRKLMARNLLVHNITKS